MTAHDYARAIIIFLAKEKVSERRSKNEIEMVAIIVFPDSSFQKIFCENVLRL
jgi:hypothetical protein